VREFLRSKKGFVSIFALVLLPLFVFLIAFAAQYPRFVVQSDLGLGRAVAEAARAAASCVDKRSQAEGDPRIDPDLADQVFVSMLAKNLKLDPTTLAPLPGSGLSGFSSYVLFVYNGDDRYVPAGKKYVFDGTNLAVEEVSGVGFPLRFAVSENGVVPGTDGDRTTLLEAPGVVAVVTGMAKGVMGADARTVRWAAARIVVRGE
jgi:hypothetical protein